MLTLAKRLLPVFVLVALGGCKGGTASKEVWIGHFAPLSGPDKAIGDHARQAILLAVEEVNRVEANHLTGRIVKVVHVDPRGSPTTLDAEAVRLIKVNGVKALLGGVDLGEAERLGRAAHSYDLPAITPVELPSQVAVENLFSVNAGLTFHAHVLARFASEELKVKRIALLTDSRQASSTAVSFTFSGEFSKAPGARVQEWSYKDDKELANQAGRIMKAQPEAVVYAGLVADLNVLRDRLRRDGVNVPLLLAGDGMHMTFLPQEGDTSKGIYVATPFLFGSDAGNQDFVKRYQERFHQPPDLHAALAYDGLRVLFEVMRRAKEFVPAHFQQELAQSIQPGKPQPEVGQAAPPLESVSGPFYFDRSHSARRPLFVAQFVEGQLKLIKRYDPAN